MMGFTGAVAIIGIIVAFFASFVDTYLTVQKTRKTEQQVELIESKAQQQPTKVSFAWDLARIKLEQYFDRNLNQVKWIFVVAVGVMVAGFSFVMYGVTLVLNQPVNIKVALVSAVSGIITQFIGVTFMVIYRSTLAQAGSYMSILERINSVGMAVQILDSIDDENGELKNKTRAELVHLLLAIPHPSRVQAPQTRTGGSRREA
jgi:hypothetical protein